VNKGDHPVRQRILVASLIALTVGCIVFVRTTKAEQATTPAVPRFEYCQYYTTYPKDKDFDKMGSQGWELVAFNTIGERPVNTDFVGAKEYVMTFKRQVGSGLKNCVDSRK
jgi:hypothetical protein